MTFQGPIESSFNSGKRGSLLISNSHDKRNLWWKSFRKTVLEPHAIFVVENPMTDKVPEEFWRLVEEKCHNLERHENQALRFVEAVGQGRGFGPSPIFPPEVVPAVRNEYLSRCLEPAFDAQTLPAQEDNIQVPVFDLPTPKPGLVSGFSQQAFSEAEYKELPMSLAQVGCYSDYSSGRIQPSQTVYGSFLLFERTYGHAKHEIEFAMNYCAMNGAAALNALSTLYKDAWPDNTPRPTKLPVVFSCTIDNDLGIINHHWMSEGGFFVAPLCKFDIRDMEHFMHFLAWIEAIEEWATSILLPDILKALQVLVDRRKAGYGPTKALPSPITNAEKEEMLSRSMRLAFENMPWKGERFRKTPLGVTGAMRMRSPIELSCSTDTALPAPLEDKDLNFQSREEPSTTVDPEAVVTTNARSIRSPNAQLQSSTAQATKSPAAPPIVSAHQQANDQEKSHTALSRIETAASAQSIESAKEVRGITSTGVPRTESSIASIQHTPAARVENSKSPGITINSVGLSSPSQSTITVQSKRSFTSLKRAKVKSPKISESGTNDSPKGTNFMSKISTSLDIIKEHALPKRTRSDNSAPSSAKGAPPMPTPAYDKKRFDVSTPRPQPVETSKTVSETSAPPPTILPMTATQSTSTVVDVSNLTASEAYNARHTLPLRQWAKSPTSAVTTNTTLTAIEC